MSRVYWMVTVTERGREARFQRLYEEYGISAAFTSYGYGTATSEVLDTFGLEASEKAVMHALVTEETFQEVRQALERRFHIDVPGTGIVFLIPISSFGGKKQLSFLLGTQDFVKSEETVMKHTEQELIIVIANQGYTDVIMNAARTAGVGGGTVLHAKGTGMLEAKKFFGFVIAEEKEMVYIVVSSEMRERVMRQVMDETGIHSKAQAICFSLPVAATAGMRLM